MSMRLSALSRRIVASALFAGSLLVAAPAFAANDPTPNPGIILINREALLVESKAGQDMARQIQTIRQGIEDDLQKKAEKLRSDEESLAGQQSILTQDAFEAKRKVLMAQRQSLQKEADNRSRQLQAGVVAAQSKVWQAVSPILDALLIEKKAVLMLERDAVVRGTTADLDVTSVAIKLLDEKLPAVKVELTPLPSAAGSDASGKDKKTQ